MSRPKSARDGPTSPKTCPRTGTTCPGDHDELARDEHEWAAANDPVRRDDATGDRTRDLIGFLTDRLTEDLARIWAREEVRDPALRRPGMAAQVAAVDDLLRTLAAGRLPARAELRALLFGYGDHPAYQAAWTESLSRTA